MRALRNLKMGKVFRIRKPNQAQRLNDDGGEQFGVVNEGKTDSQYAKVN